MLDAGLLILRLGLGLLLMAHGAQKLFGWFGGPRLDGVTRMVASFGVRPARFWAAAAALAEFGGGALTALGLFGPLGPALIAETMLVAIALAHWSHGFWNSAGGFEFPALVLLVAAAVGLMGPGRYAIDRVIGLRPSAETTAGVLAAALISLATTRRFGHARHAPSGAA